jgi:apolipoprotein N-acyltransferase
MDNVPFSSFICYEVVYPFFFQDFLKNKSSFFVQITNDAWFRRSGMASQHLNITRFRVIENRIPVVRCANTGISCFIDSRGRIFNRTKLFTSSAESGELDLISSPGIYRKYGDWVGWSMFFIAPILFFTLFLQSLIRKRK